MLYLSLFHRALAKEACRCVSGVVNAMESGLPGSFTPLADTFLEAMLPLTTQVLRTTITLGLHRFCFLHWTIPRICFLSHCLDASRIEQAIAVMAESGRMGIQEMVNASSRGYSGPFLKRLLGGAAKKKGLERAACLRYVRILTLYSQVQ